MDPARIKIGLKSHPGHHNEENDDRVLIGMDPAANDWLYSPDEVLTGEFGSIIGLVDGIGKGKNGGKAASLVCNTIKKLFNETLELPPDTQELLRLLVKFFKIANQQLILKAREIPNLSGFGCTATLALIKDQILYVVWVGDCRIYRYAPKGVEGSYFFNHENLEQLNVDHNSRTEALTKALKKTDVTKPLERSRFFGQDHNDFEPGIAHYRLRKNDKILLCSEGCYDFVSENQIADTLKSDANPDILAENLVSMAYNATADKNITAIVVEVLNGPIPSPKERLSNDQLLTKALALLTTELDTNFVDKTKTSQEERENNDLKPLKLRTVLPDDDEVSREDSPIEKESDYVDDEPSNDDQEVGHEQQQPDENEKEKPTVYTDIRQEKQERYDNLEDSSERPRPRVIATAYPDPEPGDVNSQNIEREERTQKVGAGESSNAIDDVNDEEDSTDPIEQNEDDELILEEEDDQEEDMSFVSNQVTEKEEEPRRELKFSESPKTDTVNNDISPENQASKRRGVFALISSSYLRVGIIIMALILLAVIIYKNIGVDNTTDDPLLEKIEEKPAEATKGKQELEKDNRQIGETKEQEQKPSIVEEKKPEKPKEEEEKPQKTPPTEPNYDEKIKANKDKLAAEIESLIARKNERCRQVNTYKSNAPSSKISQIDPLIYDCDQLNKKFQSIYDNQTGYFNTVRYDLLASTIENIKFSLDQLDSKFERVRRAD